MKNLFIISESEKQRILGMHKKATQKHYLSEAITAQEPIATSGSGFKVFFGEGKFILPEEATVIVVTRLKQLLKSSMPTIEKFYNNSEFSIPKFIEIGASTSSTGSRETNAMIANKRIVAMEKLIQRAFMELGKETGNVVGADYVKSFMTTNTDSTYSPTGLISLYDANKSAPKPEERFAYVIIKPLKTMGKNESQLDVIEDMLIIARGLNINPDEDGIANAICKLQTYSDITDLNDELRGYGGLETFINTTITDGLTSLGSDTEEREKIKGCLNTAAKNSGKDDIADTAGGVLTITGI